MDFEFGHMAHSQATMAISDQAGPVGKKRYQTRLGCLQAWIWDTYAHQTLNTFLLSDPKVVIPYIGS